MPSTVQVKVDTVGSTVRGSSNMVEITGKDLTNDRGFKKAFFETTKDGARTKNATIADGLSRDDFIEVTLDDSSYKNVQFIKKIAGPSGASEQASAAADTGNRGGGGGKSSGMSKEEWALKDAKKELSMARHKAIEASAIIAGGKGITKTVVDSIENLAGRLTAYILTGDFNGEVVEPTLKVSKPVDEPVDPGNSGEGSDVPGPEDDDIPF